MSGWLGGGHLECEPGLFCVALLGVYVRATCLVIEAFE